MYDFDSFVIMVELALNGVTWRATKPPNFYIEHGRRIEDKLIVLSKNELRNAIQDGTLCENIVTTHITDMSGLFFNEHSFNGDVSSWDTSRVTDMCLMFG